MNNKVGIVFLNGPQASGKSTVASNLAKLFPKSVVLDTDLIRGQIIGGLERPGTENVEEFTRQRILAAHSAIAQAKIFHDAGYVVLIPSMTPFLNIIKEYFPALERIDNVLKILLFPNKEILYLRDSQRPEFKQRPKEAISRTYDMFSNDYFSDWIKLDTSSETAEESAQAIKNLA